MPPVDLLSRATNSFRRRDLYGWCLQQDGVDATNTTSILQCLAGAVLNHPYADHDDEDNNNNMGYTSIAAYVRISNREFVHSVALLLCAALVWFMQAGFCMLCAGVVRKKNLQNTLLKNLLDASGAALAWFFVGYALAFGGDSDNANNPSYLQTSSLYNSTAIPTPSPMFMQPTTTFMGTSNFCLAGLDPGNFILWFFTCSFGAAATTIIAGTLAERCQMTAYFGYALVLAGWVYPIIAHAVWSRQGWLSSYNDSNANVYYDGPKNDTLTDNHSMSGFHAPLFGVGMVDFAGAGVVHLTGGFTALIATIILGPRRGRFHDETGRKLDKPRDFPGHDMSLQMLGT